MPSTRSFPVGKDARFPEWNIDRLPQTIKGTIEVEARVALVSIPHRKCEASSFAALNHASNSNVHLPLRSIRSATESNRSDLSGEKDELRQHSCAIVSNKEVGGTEDSHFFDGVNIRETDGARGKLHFRVNRNEMDCSRRLWTS